MGDEVYVPSNQEHAGCVGVLNVSSDSSTLSENKSISLLSVCLSLDVLDQNIPMCAL